MFPFTHQNATLRRHYDLLLERKRSYQNLFQVGSIPMTAWDSKELNKLHSLKTVVGQAKSPIETAESHYLQFKKYSWWRNVVFASSKRRSEYFERRKQVLDEVDEAHRKMDAMRDLLIGYLEDVSFLEHQRTYIELLQMTPKGPLTDFYRAVFKVTTHSDKFYKGEETGSLLADAEALFHKAAYAKCSDAHLLDQLYCRGRFLSEFYSACIPSMSEHRGDDKKVAEINRLKERQTVRYLPMAQGLYAVLCRYQYWPAYSALANSAGAVDSVSSTFHSNYKAAKAGFPPAMAQVGQLYIRYIRLEFAVSSGQDDMKAELDDFPACFKDAAFEVFAQNALLDSVFNHDNHEGQQMLSDFVKTYEAAQQLNEPTVRVLSHKLDALYRAYRKREAIEFREEAAADSAVGKPQPLTPTIELHARTPNKLFKLLGGLKRVLRFKTQKKVFSQAKPKEVVELPRLSILS